MASTRLHRLEKEDLKVLRYKETEDIDARFSEVERTVTAWRHAVTVRSTSLKRASISSVSLYLSTFRSSFSSRWSLVDAIRIVKLGLRHFLTSNCTPIADQSQDFCKLA